MTEKELYRQRKAEGICVECGGRPARPGRVLCPECSDKASVKSRELYAWRKANGICTGCGKEKAEPGKTRCWRCRLNMNAASAAWHGIQVQERRDAGLCVWCGAPADGMALCADCAAKRRESVKKFREEKT